MITVDLFVELLEGYELLAAPAVLVHAAFEMAAAGAASSEPGVDQLAVTVAGCVNAAPADLGRLSARWPVAVRAAALSNPRHPAALGCGRLARERSSAVLEAVARANAAPALLALLAGGTPLSGKHSLASVLLANPGLALDDVCALVVRIDAARGVDEATAEQGGDVSDEAVSTKVLRGAWAVLAASPVVSRRLAGQLVCPFLRAAVALHVPASASEWEQWLSPALAEANQSPAGGALEQRQALAAVWSCPVVPEAARVAAAQEVAGHKFCAAGTAAQEVAGHKFCAAGTAARAWLVSHSAASVAEYVASTEKLARSGAPTGVLFRRVFEAEESLQGRLLDVVVAARPGSTVALCADGGLRVWHLLEAADRRHALELLPAVLVGYARLGERPGWVAVLEELAPHELADVLARTCWDTAASLARWSPRAARVVGDALCPVLASPGSASALASLSQEWTGSFADLLVASSGIGG